ncbi:DUF4435 domain-containing protein [Clostridium swellfunianum]|uniref:DUF4435 domain-containing protein n=1 Tax=Clostridium swellfunianum TaxID=1367462 RepID=UPI00202DF2D5|nr:DUF4435 domain-containing protein [Clostridium swellfunianum]MCM0647251.1 DUF4435 domain-containing protein [Clostridium swellfunianum]
MHENMESTIEELLNEAIMSEVPFIIVEGADDISFYQMLSEHIKKDTEVIAVENIYSYSEGCDNVIKAIEDIQTILNQKESNKNYLLGIVDRDSRFYRNCIPNLTSLFILKYYSYESHLANRHGLTSILPAITSVSQKMLDGSVLEFIEKDLQADYLNLFYFSLEALKFACDKNYRSVVRYKQKPGKIFAKDYVNILKENIFKKKTELDTFASEYSISMGDLRYIAKGKWLLHVYADRIYNNIKELSTACKDNKVTQCQYCKVGKHDKCLYKIKSNFQLGQIISMLLSEYDENEVKYIKERISLLA